MDNLDNPHDQANPETSPNRFTINGYLDLETLATTPNASVWQLGFTYSITDHVGNQTFVAAFDESIQVTLDTENEHDPFLGATQGYATTSTLRWLDEHDLTPENPSYGELISDNPTLGLASFNAICLDFISQAMVEGFDVKLTTTQVRDILTNRNLSTIYTWGNFDQPIYEHACKQHKLQSIFHYGSFCSLRDVCKFHNFEQSFRPDTSTHEAIRDALALRIFHGELADRLNKLIMSSNA